MFSSFLCPGSPLGIPGIPQELKDGWAEASAKLVVAAAMARGELGPLHQFNRDHSGIIVE